MPSPKQNLDFGLKAAAILLICLVWLNDGSRQVLALDDPLESWNPPVVGSLLKNHYLQPSSPYTKGHRGVDYEVKLGQPVFAPFDGVVWFVGSVVDREVLTISHRGDLLTSFEPVCSFLKPGQEVLAGDLIGEVCLPKPQYQQHCEKTLCLHFSLRHQQEYLSPLVFIGGLNPSRLLPWIEPEDP
jgi:murein DD-endopeptidase MepM/ murein hydrolase activator NlpD